MLEQIRRLGETIDAYQRLARVEPLLGKIELNGMVREVLALEGLAAGKRSHFMPSWRKASLPAAPRQVARECAAEPDPQRLRGDCGQRKYHRAHWFPRPSSRLE